MNPLVRNTIVWAAIIGAVLLFYRLIQPGSAPADLMDSTQFAEALKAGKITRVNIPQDATIGGELSDRRPDGSAAHFVIATPAYRDLVDDLLKANVSVHFYSPRESSLLTTVLSWIPMLFLVGVWIYFMRTMQAARRKAETQPGSPIAP